MGRESRKKKHPVHILLYLVCVFFFFQCLLPCVKQVAIVSYRNRFYLFQLLPKIGRSPKPNIVGTRRVNYIIIIIIITHDAHGFIPQNVCEIIILFFNMILYIFFNSSPNIIIICVDFTMIIFFLSEIRFAVQ